MYGGTIFVETIDEGWFGDQVKELPQLRLPRRSFCCLIEIDALHRARNPDKRRTPRADLAENLWVPYRSPGPLRERPTHPDFKLLDLKGRTPPTFAEPRARHRERGTHRAHSGSPAFRRPSINSFEFDCPPRAIHAEIVKAGSVSSTRATASRASASRPRWAKADARQR